MTTANKPARAYRHYTPQELDCLKDNYGLVCDKVLAVRLQRSERAITNIVSRKHVVSRKDNFYTARTLAKVLGIPCRRSVILWVKKGWLNGRLSAMSQGKKRLWRFSEYGIVECLRQRPWLVDVNRMERHLFRSVVLKQWQRDPWYTVGQAAHLFGFTNPDTVYKYIHRGWLPAETRPCRGGQEGAWIIRRSAIRAFLENDPRPKHRYIAVSTARKRFIVSSGEPSRVATIWVIKCPRCGQEVRIEADPQLRGPEIRNKFAEIYVNGNCTHGSACLISTYPIAESRKGGESNGRACENSAGANRLLPKG